MHHIRSKQRITYSITLKTKRLKHVDSRRDKKKNRNVIRKEQKRDKNKSKTVIRKGGKYVIKIPLFALSRFYPVFIRALSRILVSYHGFGNTEK